MDTKRVFSIVMVGAFLAASAGVSQAGGYMHKSKGHEKSMKHQTDAPYSEIETDEYGEGGAPAEFWGPVEAGTLSGTDESSGLQDTGVDPSRWEETGE